MAYPHHVFKAPFGLCDWTITTMVNLLSIGTSTFLVYRHDYALFNLSVWHYQEVFGWSQWHWAKQLTLSWQNGFHHSMCIVPLICLLHASEEQAYPWQLLPVLSGSKNYWNEMKSHKPRSIYFFPPSILFEVLKKLFWKVIMASHEICVFTISTLNCFPI